MIDNKVFNNNTFIDLLAVLQHDCDSLMFQKGKEYSGDYDRLANFRRNAEALGLTKEQILLVYAEKHWGAIQSYVKNGNQVSSTESIEGRVMDLINYLTLFYAMLYENKQEKDTAL